MKKTGLETLNDRREKLCTKLFNSIESNKDHKLNELLPDVNMATKNLRMIRKYKLPMVKTNRFKNSFILSQAAYAKF